MKRGITSRFIMMMSVKKIVVVGILIILSLVIASVFGLIQMVGNDNSYVMMKNLAQIDYNNNVIKKRLDDNVTKHDLSPQPPAAAPFFNNGFAYGYTSWEGKRKQKVKAEGFKEEDEEIMSSPIGKGMTSVKQLFKGRMTEGIYGMYMSGVTSAFGIVATHHQVSRDIFIKHAAAFLIMWLVNVIIGVWVMTQNDGQLLSTVWYSVMEIFYLTLIAAPLIVVNCFVAHCYTWEGVQARLGIRESGAERARQYFIQQLQRLVSGSEGFAHGLDEDNLC